MCHKYNSKPCILPFYNLSTFDGTARKQHCLLYWLEEAQTTEPMSFSIYCLSKDP